MHAVASVCLAIGASNSLIDTEEKSGIIETVLQYDNSVSATSGQKILKVVLPGQKISA